MKTDQSSLIARLKCLVLLIALITPVCPVFGKNLTDPVSGCQLAIPDDWVITKPQVSPGTYIILATKPDHSKGISIYTCSVSSNATVNNDSAAIRGFEHGFTTNGGVIVNRQHQSVGDNNFYVAECTQKQGGKTMYENAWITMANLQMIQVALYSTTADPGSDAELTAAIKTFALQRNRRQYKNRICQRYKRVLGTVGGELVLQIHARPNTGTSLHKSAPGLSGYVAANYFSA